MKKLTVDIQCPGCHRKVSIKVQDMVPGTSRPCPYCRATFRFTGDDGRRVQRALDDLQRKLNNL